MKHQTAGYIVTDSGGGMPHTLGVAWDRQGMKVLYYGHPGTIFKTKRAAQAAIERTVKYRNADVFKDNPEKPSDFKIYRVAFPVAGARRCRT